MKKWIALALIVCVAGVAQAAKEKEPQTKEQFIAQKKASAEKSGKEFDLAKVETTFASRDKDKDGILSVEEQTPKKSEHPKKKKKEAAKK